MARLNVNPTRMQLKSLKARLGIAVRGHKLLKDKTDEMIRRYNTMVKENYQLRLSLEDSLRSLQSQFCMAKGYMSKAETLSLFNLPSTSLISNFEYNSIMSVNVPKIKCDFIQGSNLPYSYVGTNPELDILVENTKNIVPKLMELASLEKTCQILALEIERTKRRVNALEYVMIPQLKETISYIAMKIEENDRASRIRLIKVKSMINERNS